MTGKRRPIIIGLTGGIGAGKSAVARILAEAGCVVADSDALGREALTDPAIKATLVQWWGDSILDHSGDVSRRSVAAIVFREPSQRKRLEALTHPWIEHKRQEQFAAAPRDATALVIDAPLLMEAGLRDECDAVIFVAAPLALRQQRVARERGWAPSELALREQAQLPLDEKRRTADHVVSNEGDLDALRIQVNAVLKSILQSR
jgi:dephospho-CoA kinase